LYIHNLNFDGLLIINEISKLNIQYKIMSNKTNIYYLDIIYLNTTIRFRCSYKLVPLSLEKIGELENFPKKIFPHKFVSEGTLFYEGLPPHSRYWPISESANTNGGYFNLKNEAIAYCKNDVLLTVQFLEKIIKIIQEESSNILTFAYSAASVSFKLFFKKYNNQKIPQKLLKRDESYIRNSYYGGRCEVYGNIFKNEFIKYFDFSGMYAQCMLEAFHNGTGKYCPKGDYKKPGFHTIEFESNIDFLPVLPSHSENGKLLFANGAGTGTY
jgi:hypothetical protein